MRPRPRKIRRWLRYRFVPRRRYPITVVSRGQWVLQFFDAERNRIPDFEIPLTQRDGELIPNDPARPANAAYGRIVLRAEGATDEST